MSSSDSSDGSVNRNARKLVKRHTMRSSSSDENIEQTESPNENDVLKKKRIRHNASSPLTPSNQKTSSQCGDSSDGSLDEKLKNFQRMPHRRKPKMSSPLKPVMPNGYSLEDESEDAHSTEEKSTKTKGYPKYMHDELIPHLKERSKEKINNREVFSEWKLIGVEDIGWPSESCPCGKQGIRYLFHILNIRTNYRTFVGSRCITQFGESVKTLAKIAKKLLREGTKARLLGKNPDGTARFKLTPTLSLVQERRKFVKDFNSIPVQMEGTDENPVYVLTADLTDPNMTEGQDYHIWVELNTNETNDLKAKVVKDNETKQKDRTPKDVKNLFRI
ncbi:uncharacterized protein LOC117302487 isoform X2 [Asterias rubens]|uniref:uncharacterized protein LOC117302487 isoform X2 n=1 Tax=Asterias rubens TaxID=7604 RepID=UPI0014552109|nr:uncharacterized protein LOC117302487 isoform X2 [Asterias rubens]